MPARYLLLMIAFDIRVHAVYFLILISSYTEIEIEIHAYT